MGKAKELVRQGWSQWYVRTGVLTPVVLLALSLCAPVPMSVPGPIPKSVLEVRNLQDNINHLGNVQASEAYDRFQSLLSTQDLLTGLMVIVCLSVVLCYIGWTLDAGYKWIRNRWPHATERVRSALKKLWAGWYVRLATVVGLYALWIFLPSAYLTKCAWDAAQELPDLDKYGLLAYMLLVVVMAPTLIVGSLGWMLDLGYHRFRKRYQQSKKQVET
jgi:hypothetical protein